MSDHFYSIMDNFGADFSHIGAELISIDEYNRPTFSINLNFTDFMESKKLGRTMRALYMFFKSDKRGFLSGIKETIVPERNINREWTYSSKFDYNDIVGEIETYARTKAHRNQLKDQLTELRFIIDNDLNVAALSIKYYIRKLSDELYEQEIEDGDKAIVTQD